MSFWNWLLSLLRRKPVTTVVKKYRPPWVVEMMRAFGKHEHRDVEWLKAWMVSDGKTLGDPRSLPWCGDGMETAVKLSLPEEPFPGALGKNPYWARNWLLFGNKVPPMLWAIGVFRRNSGGHVGILVGEDATHYHVFGCNQNDACNVTRIEKDRLLGTRWPITYAAQQSIPLPKLSNKVATSVNEV